MRGRRAWRPSQGWVALAFGLALASASPPAVSDEGRLLVTLHRPPPAASLSPSGRMGYLPRDPAHEREALRARAERVGRAYGLVIEDVWPIHALHVDCILFRVPEPARAAEVMQALRQLEEVDAVQPLQHFTGAATAVGGGSAPLRLKPRDATGRGVTVAVIDTGADLAHAALARSRIRARDFVDGRAAVPPEAHGTAVLGLILARGTEAAGVRGLAPDAELLLLRACWEEAEESTAVCNSFTLAKALSAALGAEPDILNLSIVGPRDPLLERLAHVALERGVVLVAAGETRATFPGAVTGSLLAAELAPDTGFLTLLPGDRYGLRRGTSLVAARVSALAAREKEKNPRARSEEIASSLRSLPVD